MATKAIAAIGTLIKIGTTTASDSKTQLPGVKDIDGPKFGAAQIDVTSHDSTGGFDETIPGTRTSGTIDFNMNFVQGDYAQELLASYWLANTRFYIDMILPVDLDSLPVEDRTSTYLVSVAALSVLAPVKGVLERRCSLAVIGAPIHLGS